MGEILDKLADEIKKGKGKLLMIMKNIEGQMQDYDAMAAQAEHEIKKLEAQPQTSGRDHLLHVYRLRYQAAVRGKELLVTMMSVNVDDPQSDKNFTNRNSRLNSLKTLSSYLSTDFTVVNYRPIARAIRETLQGNGVPGTGPLGQARGPLSQRTPTGPLQGAPQPRPGTGPLSQPRSGSGPLQPPGAGTGPLGKRGESAPGSGPLPQPAADSPLQRLYQGLNAAIAKPDQRRLLEQVVAAFDDVEATIAPLRGPNIGEIGLPEAEAAGMLTKVAGKVYYLNRAVQQLEPTLQRLIVFESEEQDQALQAFEGKRSARAADDAPKGPITNRLKSMFGLQ